MKKRLLSALLLLLFSVVNAQSYTFKYNWKKGQRFHFEAVSDQDITMDGKLSDQKISIGYSINVEDINPDGSYKCRVEYDKMSLKSTALADVGMQEAIDKSMGNMVGLFYYVQIAPTGERVKVWGAGEMLKNYGYKMYPGTSPEDKFKREDFTDRLATQMNDSTLGAEFERLGSVYLPKGEIKINDSWVTKVQSGSLTDLSAKYTLKLRSVDKANIATVELAVSSTADRSEVGSLSMQANLVMSGDGIIKIDLNTGLIISGDIKINGEGTIESGYKKSDIVLKAKNIITQQEIKN